MYDTQQSTALPDRPALQNWWILICHYMKMCHGRNKWKCKNTKRSREEMEQKWPSNLSEEVQKAETMFLKMPDLLMPCTYTLTSTSARRITSLSENALCEHAKKMNLSHCFFLSCPFSFPIVSDTQQSLKGKKKGFSYFCLQRHFRVLDMSALFSGARHVLLQMKTKIHPPGWIINNTHTQESHCPQERRGVEQREE